MRSAALSAAYEVRIVEIVELGLIIETILKVSKINGVKSDKGVVISGKLCGKGTVMIDCGCFKMKLKNVLTGRLVIYVIINDL